MFESFSSKHKIVVKVQGSPLPPTPSFCQIDSVHIRHEARSILT